MEHPLNHTSGSRTRAKRLAITLLRRAPTGPGARGMPSSARLADAGCNVDTIIQKRAARRRPAIAEVSFTISAEDLRAAAEQALSRPVRGPVARDRQNRLPDPEIGKVPRSSGAGMRLTPPAWGRGGPFETPRPARGIKHRDDLDPRPIKISWREFSRRRRPPRAVRGRSTARFQLRRLGGLQREAVPWGQEAR